MREIVTGMCVNWGVSIRKACGAICFDTSSYHYKSRGTHQAAVERRIKEIASDLHISVRTVEDHKARLMESLGLESTADLVRFAIKQHIVPSE